ncbi:MAG: polysaccharide biosynthesis protein [Lachnospiraceae bacterium]|nr:polysaccharide biosynthesis protein [Lachnospiraceae bacterium]
MNFFKKKDNGITYFVDSRKRVERALVLGFADVVTVLFSTFLALWVRFDFRASSIIPRFLESAVKLLPINIATTVIIFIVFQLYKSVWRYASADEMLKIIGAVITEGLTLLVITLVFKISVPRSYYFFYPLFLGIFAVGIRFSYRFLRVLRGKGFFGKTPDDRKNVMIVGAGAAGNSIMKEIEASSYVNMTVKCFIDDNEGVQGKILRGIPIVGGRDEIPSAVEKFEIDEIIIAIPSASRQETKKIIEICKETGCKLQIVPGIYQLINGDVSVSQLREVSIEDLLGREPVKINVDEIAGYVKGKTVLVTGGGGSIGSELCRQLAKHEPKRLIVVDIYENNAYDIQQELKIKCPDLDFIALIASVRNAERIEQIFEEYKPEIVYHAAAHKHVPLMEESPGEAVKNNVFGTLNVAEAADKYGAEKFVLISTDKAVNPTNIMGASKRICEMIIQMMNERSKTEFVAVRFGNVLGSNGSVIPLFKKQIEAGGPVTVTDPNIIRYFMTIPEAVSLILQAGAYAKGGEIFVLDMGEPVKILDLAQNLIKLSGYRVGDDIEIVFTGLRPGEKMYEELLMSEEGLKGTENALIHIGKPIEFNYESFIKSLENLKKMADDNPKAVKYAIGEIVETYHPVG